MTTDGPATFRESLIDRTVRALDRRGKYLLAQLSSDDVLIMHLGMSGPFRVEHATDDAREPEKYDHVDIRLSSGGLVIFNDPRRFGVIDLVPSGHVGSPLGLGPEPLPDTRVRPSDRRARRHHAHTSESAPPSLARQRSPHARSGTLDDR